MSLSLYLSLSLSLSLTHTLYTLSLSRSLSLSHTHTHTKQVDELSEEVALLREGTTSASNAESRLAEQRLSIMCTANRPLTERNRWIPYAISPKINPKRGTGKQVDELSEEVALLREGTASASNAESRLLQVQGCLAHKNQRPP